MTTVINKNGIPFDIDAIATDLNGKADVDLTNCTKPHIVETYQNGTSWYRVYSDGWCEQGGFFGGQSSAQNKVCTFLKPFKDTNYKAHTTVYTTKTKDGYAYWMGTVASYSTTSMTVRLDTNAYYEGAWWSASGFIQ